jgi:hypothetical protein
MMKPVLSIMLELYACLFAIVLVLAMASAIVGGP